MNFSALKTPAILTPAILYAALSAVLWFLPLLQILHAESSAVIALASFFVSGLSALRLLEKSWSVQRILQVHWLLLLIPLGMLTVSLFWQPNCEYGRGLLFYGLFPGITVFFAVTVACFLFASPIAHKARWIVGLGIGISLAGPIYDIGFHPQFYTYNHVFGGVMGPIYDEELRIRFGLVAFRGLTVLWGAFLWVTAVRIKAGRRPLLLSVSGLTLLASIGLMYLFSAPLRFNTPVWYLQQQLGGHLATRHFDIYYDPRAMSDEELRRLRHEHEFRYEALQQRLGISVSRRIQSYIYPDPETKDRLTGSRTTSVAPVWMRAPQMHQYRGVFEQSFAHELAHVFSREFGMPIINASRSVGLVEGLAVALEPPDGRPHPHDQVLTAATLRYRDFGGDSVIIGERLKAQMTPLGFWTGRGAVSYTTMGSFVAFLAERYGYPSVMEVYARANFNDVYGKPVEALVEEWEAFLKRRPLVSRSAHDYVTQRFAIPSLFEKRCPHHIPPSIRRHRAASAALALQDSTEALSLLEESLRLEPAYQNALEDWSELQLAAGRPDSVISRLERVFSGDSSTYMTPELWLRLGDAYAIEREPIRARFAYEEAENRVPLYGHQYLGMLDARKAALHAPDLIATLVSPLDPEAKAKRLERWTEQIPAVPLMQGLLLVTAKRYDEALLYLNAFDAGSDEEPDRDPSRSQARLQRMAIAFAQYRSGRFEAAYETALHLQREFRQLGAFPEAELYADFAARMRYIGQRTF